MSGETQYVVADEFVFRPRGLGRIPGALFLALWLSMWAVGEAFALFILGHGVWSLLTGSPAFGSGEPAKMMPALAVGAFMLIWLSIWTCGGVMAIQELFRLLWAEDRLVLEHDILLHVRQRGPFKSTRRMPRDEIWRVFVRPANTALMIQLDSSLVELTDLGTPAQRVEAAQCLCAALELPERGKSAEPAALPDDWQEATGQMGEQLLVPNLDTRRKQAFVVAIFTGLVWTGLMLLAREALDEPNLWVVMLMLAALGVWLARQTLWLLRGRKEWRVEPGRLVHQTRISDEVTELFEARALELTETHDSDGDPWYHLYAIELVQSPIARAGSKTPEKIRITHSIRDSTEPRCLGQWLSQKTAVPLHDRVPTEEDKQAERARMMERLEGSGKLGSILARLLKRKPDRHRGN